MSIAEILTSKKKQNIVKQIDKINFVSYNN